MNQKKFVSRELAEKIANVAEEKGVKLPECEYVWAEDMQGEWEIITRSYAEANDGNYTYCSAFDTFELGEILPDRIDDGFQLEQHFNNKITVVYTHSHKYGHQEDGDTEPEARGKMLLYLLENDLLTPIEK